MIANVLLDLDGTLLDSNDAHAKCWVEALAENQIHVEFENVRKLIGMGSDQLLPRLTGIDAETPQGKKISQRRGEIFRKQYLKTLKPFPKSRELVEKILQSGLQIVVATSASKGDLKGILEQIGIEDLIEHATHSDDADQSKPEPDIIIEAMDKIKAAPQETVMLGDTPWDIKAAAKAGVITVAFTCGGWNSEDLKDAIAVYEGPWQLLENFEDSALCGHLDKKLFARHVENRPASLM